MSGLNDIYMPPTVFDLMAAIYQLENGAQCVWCYHPGYGPREEVLAYYDTGRRKIAPRKLARNRQEAENFYLATLPELPYGPGEF